MDNSLNASWVDFVENVAGVVMLEKGCKTVSDLFAKISVEVKRQPPTNGSLHGMFREEVTR
jgi:hypothetical protein